MPIFSRVFSVLSADNHLMLMIVWYPTESGGSSVLLHFPMFLGLCFFLICLRGYVSLSSFNLPFHSGKSVYYKMGYWLELAF